MSHSTRIASHNGHQLNLTNEWIESFVEDARLPTPATQAANLIAVVGDSVSQNGMGYFIDTKTDTSLVGSFDEVMFTSLLSELEKTAMVTTIARDQIPNPRGHGVLSGYRYGLTLAGWERYEDEKRGRFESNLGFLAMQLGTKGLNEEEMADLEELFSLVSEVLKPTIREMGYDIRDMREHGRSGLIDNIMIMAIRDSRFCIADLTHDNHGAYWEAGYAEGLGKPVIYICKRNKFENKLSHFDTNHRTTVLWSRNEDDLFKRELVATLRRSLDM